MECLYTVREETFVFVKENGDLHRYYGGRESKKFVRRASIKDTRDRGVRLRILRGNVIGEITLSHTLLVIIGGTMV